MIDTHPVWGYDEILNFDDFLDEEDHHKIWEDCVSQDYKPMIDHPDISDKPSGALSPLSLTDSSVKILMEACLGIPELKWVLKTKYRKALFNKYFPKEPTYFHYDAPESGTTLVYFPNVEETSFHFGGETQVLKKNQELVGVFPKPNRLMVFNGSLWHKGNSFTNDTDRYSLAIQFEDN